MFESVKQDVLNNANMIGECQETQMKIEQVHAETTIANSFPRKLFFFEFNLMYCDLKNHKKLSNFAELQFRRSLDIGLKRPDQTGFTTIQDLYGVVYLLLLSNTISVSKRHMLFQGKHHNTFSFFIFIQTKFCLVF